MKNNLSEVLRLSISEYNETHVFAKDDWYYPHTILLKNNETDTEYTFQISKKDCWRFLIVALELITKDVTYQCSSCPKNHTIHELRVDGELPTSYEDLVENIFFCLECCRLEELNFWEKAPWLYKVAINAYKLCPEKQKANEQEIQLWAKTLFRHLPEDEQIIETLQDICTPQFVQLANDEYVIRTPH